MAEREDTEADAVPRLGQCLIDMAPEYRPLGPRAKEVFPDDTDLAALAADTPYVQRLAAVVRRLRDVEVLSIHDAARIATSAATTRHHDGSAVPPYSTVGYLLAVSIQQGLLDIDDRPGGTELLFVGPQHDDVDGHPLAAVGEAVVPALLGAGVDGVLGGLRSRLSEEMALVPALLYQLLAHSTHVELETVVAALHAEARRQPGLRGTSRRRIESCVATVRALLVELGLAVWTPGPGGRHGQLDLAPLGCFALILFKADIEGVWPELEELFGDAGYLPCDGGYVHIDDVPIPLSNN